MAKTQKSVICGALLYLIKSQWEFYTCSITNIPYDNCCLCNIGCKWCSKTLNSRSRLRYGIKIATLCLGWQLTAGKCLPPSELLTFSASNSEQKTYFSIIRKKHFQFGNTKKQIIGQKESIQDFLLPILLFTNISLYLSVI